MNDERTPIWIKKAMGIQDSHVALWKNHIAECTKKKSGITLRQEQKGMRKANAKKYRNGYVPYFAKD